MAAPEYVPITLRSQPRQGLPLPPPPHWASGDDRHLGPRPGELGPDQPSGPQLGHQGPDQGYVFVLTRRFRDRLRLREGEDADDVLAGAAAVALKRASLFGRAPVIHDVEVALRLWGFLDDAPAELIELRRPLFQGVSSSHHYAYQRRIADLAPEAVLRKPPNSPEIRDAWLDFALGTATRRT